MGKNFIQKYFILPDFFVNSLSSEKESSLGAWFQGIRNYEMMLIVIEEHEALWYVSL